MAACIVVLEEENPQQKRKRRKYWVSPYLQERELNSGYFDVRVIVDKHLNIYSQVSLFYLFQSPSMFYETFHMLEKCFSQTLWIIRAGSYTEADLTSRCYTYKSKLAIVLD